MTTVNIDYLIPYLRLELGDISATPRYLDTWLIKALILGIKGLLSAWKNKYFVTDDGLVSRNPDASVAFVMPEDYGIIQDTDEVPIVLMAAILTLDGSLENSAWDAVAWKDHEISFSNLEQYRTKDGVIERKIKRLQDLVLPPTRKLANPRKGSLPGYKGNDYERTTLY